MSERTTTVAGGDPTTDEPATDRHRRFVQLFHGPLMSRLILGFALILTAAAWYTSHVTVAQSEADRFEFRASEIEDAIADRMLAYENVLWAGVGLFDASDEVTRADWNEFVATMNLDQRWPGIQGLGWATPVEPDAVAGHEAALRAEGFPDYAVTPPGARDDYTAIVYLEPFDWRNRRALGFDMWTDPESRAAMTRARDSGEAATSAIGTLAQETDRDVQQGFFTYIPVYEGGLTPPDVYGKQEQLRGWVYAAFRMNDLMDGVIGTASRTVDYEIYDGWEAGTDRLLYDSNPESVSAPNRDDGLRYQTTVLVHGQPWTIAFEPGPDFHETSDATPTYVAIAGVIIDALLFYVISSLGLLNRRANSLAAEMTVELRQTNEELHERTLELERQAIQLQRSNDDLRQFAYAASHDLQEPLRTMGSYSSLMIATYDEQLDDEGKRWLSYINSSAKRLSELIRELRQFSTVAEIRPGEEPVDLNRTMAAVLAGHASLIGETGAEFRIAQLPAVPGDGEQLRNLLSNLVSNALNYRDPDRAPEIEIGATAVDDGGWRIHVRDNGTGIEADFQDKVFEVFRRAARGAESDRGPGSDPRTGGSHGMGLAMCRKIVQGHGGEIGVSSTPGVGSEFWFVLPASGEPLRRAEDRVADTDDETNSPTGHRAADEEEEPLPGTEVDHDESAAKENV